MNDRSIRYEGIRIEDVLTGSRVKVFKLPENIPLDRQNQCPSCANPLKPVCVFSNAENNQEIRFGLCDFCGYGGYMDRPTKEWMVDFYRNKWDKQSPRTREDVIKSSVLPKEGAKAGRYLTFSLINKMSNVHINPINIPARISDT